MRKIITQAVAVILTVCILFAGSAGFLPIFNDERHNGTDIGSEEPTHDDDAASDDKENTDGPGSPTVLPEEEPSDGENSTPEEDNSNDDLPVEEATPPPATVVYVRSKVDGLNIRSGPGTKYTSLGTINRGDMLILHSAEDGWYRTVYKNKTAYLSAGTTYTETYEMTPSEDKVIEKVIEEGLQLLGFPYVYGATRLHDGKGNILKNFDATKYDCSSLMQYIFYYGAGANLNMTTRTQVSQGSFVARNNIRRGDLIFFTNSARYNKTGIERIGHVALYLGENYILHTATDYAVIEEISAQRWKYYIETRRMV